MQETIEKETLENFNALEHFVPIKKNNNILIIKTILIGFVFILSVTFGIYQTIITQKQDKTIRSLTIANSLISKDLKQAKSDLALKKTEID